MTSIRRGMLFILLSAFTVVWVLTSALVVYNVRNETSSGLDDGMRQLAYFTWTKAAQSKQVNFRDIDELPQYLADSFGRYQSFAFQVWDGQTLLSKSDNAPIERMSSRPGFKNGVLNGQPWRFYYRVDAFEGLDVIVATESRFSGDVAKAIAWSTTWPMAVALIVITLLSFWGVTLGLSPLRRLTAQIHERTPTSMDPIDERTVPKEVRALVHALNELLKRLDTAMESERRFNANASHELRTPLAAIEVQSKVALDARNEQEQTRALEKIRVNVGRGRRLIEQLLEFARLDQDRSVVNFEEIDLKTLVTDELAQIAPEAIEKSIDLELDAPAQMKVSGHKHALSILVRNLLDNAIRYTPEGGSILVSLSGSRSAACLQIEDSGSGIAEEELDKVFDRFYRVMGTPSTGSGLGLSIVSKIAELHQAELTLNNKKHDHGLIVQLNFPRQEK